MHSIIHIIPNKKEEIVNHQRRLASKIRWICDSRAWLRDPNSKNTVKEWRMLLHINLRLIHMSIQLHWHTMHTHTTHKSTHMHMHTTHTHVQMRVAQRTHLSSVFSTTINMIGCCYQGLQTVTQRKRMEIHIQINEQIWRTSYCLPTAFSVVHWGHATLSFQLRAILCRVQKHPRCLCDAL